MASPDPHRNRAIYPLEGFQKQRFLDWLCTPPDQRQPSNMRALADELGVHWHNLQVWKKDPDFYAAWEARYREVVGAPDKAQTVIERLYETATDRTDPRQVPAAKAYLEAIDVLRPKRIDVTVTRSPKDLTDDDLYALLADKAARELETRHDA